LTRGDSVKKIGLRQAVDVQRKTSQI